MWSPLRSETLTEIIPQRQILASKLLVHLCSSPGAPLVPESRTSTGGLLCLPQQWLVWHQLLPWFWLEWAGQGFRSWTWSCLSLNHQICLLCAKPPRTAVLPTWVSACWWVPQGQDRHPLSPLEPIPCLLCPIPRSAFVPELCCERIYSFTKRMCW